MNISILDSVTRMGTFDFRAKFSEPMRKVCSKRSWYLKVWPSFQQQESAGPQGMRNIASNTMDLQLAYLLSKVQNFSVKQEEIVRLV